MSATFHLIHKLTVSLFLLAYIVRLIGLLGNIRAIQNLFAQKFTRIVVDMILSTAFLVTGVWMLLNIPGAVLSVLVLIKIALVVISIPIAIVGFKKGNKILAILATLLLVASYGLGEMAKKSPVVQQNMIGNAVGANELFVAGNCAVCHGENGAKPNEAVGAKDLSKSTLTDDQLLHVISNGKNSMPGYKKKFSDEQLKELVEYVKGLKSPSAP